MPRRGESRLFVWENGMRVGVWQFTEAAGHRFHYDADWIDSDYGHPLSCSLPLRPADDAWHGARVGRFFDSLLPDHPQQRQRLRRAFGAASSSAMDLLRHVGRDCPGALQLTADDQPPPLAPPGSAPAIDDESLAAILAGLRQAPAQTGADVPMPAVALPGSSDKTAIVCHQSQWRLPGSGVASTHLLRLPIERHRDCGWSLNGSLENAWLCQRAASQFGIPVPACDLVNIGGERALLIARADRCWDEAQGVWRSLPQEDMCQARGLPAEMKYQVQGGQSAAAIARFMLGSSDAAADRVALLRAMLVFWLLCAFDGHARRFTIRLLPQGRFRLGMPLGVLSAHPLCGSGAGKLSPGQIRLALGFSDAMPANWRFVDGANWRDIARDWALPPETVANQIVELTEQTVPVTARLRKHLPPGFPVTVSEPILQGLVQSARQLRGSLSD